MSGESVEYFYNDASGMTSLIHKLNGNSFVSFAYAYNSVGNRTNRVESGTGLQPVTDVYTYDATDQVSSVNYNAGTRTVSYQWDAVGNRTTVTDNGTGTNYTANSLNQYTAIGGGSPTYDSKGNLITQNGWTYTFDAQNRLTLAEPTVPADGNQKMIFAYDALNRCVHRQTYTRITGNWSLITDYFLIYDGWNLIEEWTTGGAQVAHYVHGPRMDELLVKVSTTNAVYFHLDGLGNTTHLTATNGAVVERYTYDIFGKPTILDANSQLLSATAFGNRMLFTGREWLAEISLYDYRNRVYSPELGRFLQTDPIRFAAGDVNIYRFVANSPNNAIDPLGLDTVVIYDGNDPGGSDEHGHRVADGADFTKAAYSDQLDATYKINASSAADAAKKLQILASMGVTITTIHIIDHGNSAYQFLGPYPSYINPYSTAWKSITSVLTSGGNVILYGCNTASYANNCNGNQYIQYLSQQGNCIVTGYTGPVYYGGGYPNPTGHPTTYYPKPPPYL